jgi:tetratricopeptide (TPR) repeat protein
MPVPDLAGALDRLDRGDTADLVYTLEYLAELFPASVTAQALLARACESEGRWGDALSAWQRVYFLLPGSAAAASGIRRAALAVTAPPPEPRPDAPDEEEEPGVTDDRPPDDDAEPPSDTERPDATPRGALTTAIDDLDVLIRELESARIVPNPQPLTAAPLELDDEGEDLVSETLARIYAAQRQFDEAARVFEILAAQQPERAQEYRRMATQMREKARDV